MPIQKLNTDPADSISTDDLTEEKQVPINHLFCLVVLHNAAMTKMQYQLREITPGSSVYDGNPRFQVRAAFAYPDEFFAYLNKMKFDAPDSIAY